MQNIEENVRPVGYVFAKTYSAHRCQKLVVIQGSCEIQTQNCEI